VIRARQTTPDVVTYLKYGPYAASLGVEVPVPLETIGGDTSGGFALGITLPDPATVPTGIPRLIKDEGGNAAAKNITVTTAAGSIQGTAVISTNYGSLRFYSNGIATWFAC